MTPTLEPEGASSYELSITEMVAVINISAHCWQEVTVECQGSYIGQRADRQWISRTNDIMHNWGTPTGTTGCACVLFQGKLLFCTGYHRTYGLQTFALPTLVCLEMNILT